MRSKTLLWLLAADLAISIAGGLTGLWLLAVDRRGLARVAAYGAGDVERGAFVLDRIYGRGAAAG